MILRIIFIGQRVADDLQFVRSKDIEKGYVLLKLDGSSQKNYKPPLEVINGKFQGWYVKIEGKTWISSGDMMKLTGNPVGLT